MGKYADTKTRKVKRFLEKLTNKYPDAIEVTKGKRARHTKVKCSRNGETYPLPLSHSIVKEAILERFFKWLIKNEICNQEYIDDHFKQIKKKKVALKKSINENLINARLQLHRLAQKVTYRKIIERSS